MMTSSRPRGDVGGSFASRRGHTSQLSISDPSHHVTEAIGTLYGEDDDSGSEGGRPLSFIGGSPYQEHLPRPAQQDDFLSPDRLSPDPRKPLTRSVTEPLDMMSMNGEYGVKTSQPLPNRGMSNRSNSFEQPPKSPLSPTLSLRDVQADSSNSPFSLPNIEHPNDIAQELSNLQALRRLSMDVGNNKDPDMPPMSLMAMPAIAPSGDDDENDPSRLLWVPARVHPELAPGEFKSFLEKRVHSIRRRSGDSFLSVDGDSSQSDSGGGLRRKKSMLSRQIDNSGGRGAVGYVDGADALDRRRSRGSYQSHELSLDELVKDPTKAVQKLTQDSQGSAGPEGTVDDMPILPVAPGMGLRRSTRTTYRKGGSIRSGERTPFSKRAVNRNFDGESAESGSTSPLEAPPGHGLSRVQSEPLADNYSRPNRSVRRQNKFSQESLGGFDPFDGASQESSAPSPAETFQDQLPIRTSSTSSVPIIETSTPEEPAGTEDDSLSRSFPQRSSSQAALEQEPTVDEPPPRSSRRNASRQTVPQSSPQQYTSRSSYPQGQSLNDNLTANPAPLPGGGAARTDSLTFIPTMIPEEKKPEKKSKKDRDDDSSSVSTKSSSAWKWFKSGADDKEKKKEENKKSKTKSLVEKAQDNVRLDVIQTSIDKNGTKGRESLIMERENTDSKLQEERKKESHRKSDAKKEKDGNIFSSIFGGSKKKEEKEKHSKKTHHLKVPEEPAYKPMVPDVDYHWTRFPLLEERAIYRMAHIKLANPRRSLLSQVLLSNFMYSYLAIVQAMHPQMNVPLSPQQKRLEEEARRKQQEQEYLEQQQMQEGQDSQEAIDNYNFDYHRAAVQYAESGGNDEVDYVDDAQIYEDEHGNDHNNGYNYDGSDGYGQGSKEYYQYHDNGGDDRRHDGRDGRDGRDDMW